MRRRTFYVRISNISKRWYDYGDNANYRNSTALYEPRRFLNRCGLFVYWASGECGGPKIWRALALVRTEQDQARGSKEK